MNVVTRTLVFKHDCHLTDYLMCLILRFFPFCSTDDETTLEIHFILISFNFNENSNFFQKQFDEQVLN